MLNPISYHSHFYQKTRIFAYFGPPAENIKCLNIIYSDSSCIIFIDNNANEYIIKAGFVSFWGEDVYTEILCNYFHGTGLDVNNPRSKEIYHDAVSKLSEENLIEFCNDNKHRWKRNFIS